MKIKNIIAVLVFSICLSSCMTTSFSTFYNEPTTATGYSDEKWLFVTSDVPADLQKDFDKQIIEFLESCHGHHFVNHKTNKNQYILPGFSYEVNKDVFINQLNKSNQINFYLHISAEVVRFDVGAGIDLNSPPARGINSYDETRIRVTFEVIDVVQKKKVYSQSVEGTTRKDETNREDILLTLPLDNQFKKAFKKGFKKFQKDFPCK